MPTTRHARLDRTVPFALALLRISAAYLFLLHGTAKLFGIPHIAIYDEVHLASLEGVAGILEVAGSVALIVGLAVRPVAFLLSGEMAFAYFIAHAPQGNLLLPILNGGELAVLFCFAFLLLSATGGGALSLDWVIARRRLPAGE